MRYKKSYADDIFEKYNFDRNTWKQVFKDIMQIQLCS